MEMRNINQLMEINKQLKTLDIKGKNYVTVNERIKAFWELFPEGRIYTEIVSLNDGVVVMRATAYENKNDDIPLATGTAYESENSSYINKVSYIENCETSCVGRCLGFLGIGIDTSVASYEETTNAIDLQKKIDNIKIQALCRSIVNADIDDEKVYAILEQFNYEKIEDICVADYKPICDALRKLKGAK